TSAPYGSYWWRRCLLRRNWRNIASLTMSAVSSPFQAHSGMHSEKSAISLVEAVPIQPRLARNRFQVRNSVRPMHLFGHNVDHDYYFELRGEGERDTQSIARCFTSHHRDFRAFPRTKDRKSVV